MMNYPLAYKYPWILGYRDKLIAGYLKLFNIRILGYLSSFGYLDSWIFQLSIRILANYLDNTSAITEKTKRNKTIAGL
jgi:hypothetical protein